MRAGLPNVPTPSNEPVLSYAPGAPERDALAKEIEARRGQVVEVPCVINGERVFTGRVHEIVNPSANSEVIARVHLAGPAEVEAAIAGAMKAKHDWANMDWDVRAAVLRRAADLLAGPRRQALNATTLLGQGKTPHQAEIDSACELIDFWRFNAWYSQDILAGQPPISAPGTWNRLDHRPLDGFVFAVTPFNFTAIALNLPTAPALMGNVVLWKPSVQESLSAWEGYQLLEAAGLPPGVIQFVNGLGPDVGDPVLASPDLGGLHFTGSTATFQHLWRSIGQNISSYRQYPRIVGETGGKDFIVAHPSADAPSVATAILRGGFEYQGQKCSAASRIFVPRGLWTGGVRDQLVADMAQMKQGDVADFSTFVGPVIDERAFDKISGYVDLAHQSAEVLAGGTYDRTHGWYVSPTVAVVDDPRHRLMTEEIFGPVVSVYVYDDDDFTDLLPIVDDAAPYALTGAIFARDRAAIAQASDALRFAAGNFYINDKPTGAVVGQQPFGGGRASGTNDKAGSPLNLLRWVSPRSIKETFVPPTDWRYPYLG